MSKNRPNLLPNGELYKDYKYSKIINVEHTLLTMNKDMRRIVFYCHHVDYNHQSWQYQNLVRQNRIVKEIIDLSYDDLSNDKLYRRVKYLKRELHRLQFIYRQRMKNAKKKKDKFKLLNQNEFKERIEDIDRNFGNGAVYVIDSLANLYPGK